MADVERNPRLVVDLSPQNAYLHDRRFKYETIPAFVSMLKRGDHMASWDVSDAFRHIRLAPREQLRLAFRVRKTLYVALTLPFGLKLAPWALTKLLRPVIQHLRSLGYLILPYMDDFAISVDQPEPVSAAQATAAREFAVALFSRLGLHVHLTKETATGTCRLEILGFLIDTESCLLILPSSRRHKLVGAAHSLLGAAALDRRWVRSQALQRFCGMAASASLAIPLSRHRLRSLFSSLRGPRGRSRLSTLAMRDLTWWASLHTIMGIGRTLWEEPTAMDLDTDASSFAWGAVRDRVTPARGFFDLTSRGFHINRKELLAIIYAIESFPTASGPGVVRIRTDSTVVMAVVNSLCSRSPSLHRDVTRLRRLLRARGLGIEATWLASVENKWADRLSREEDSTDWHLSRSAWEQLDRAWGPLTIDRFATPLSTMLVRFNARRACPGAEAVDAMAQSWARDANYCAPPFAMAATVLRKIFVERPRQSLSSRSGRLSPGGAGPYPERTRRSSCRRQPSSLPAGVTPSLPRVRPGEWSRFTSGGGGYPPRPTLALPCRGFPRGLPRLHERWRPHRRPIVNRRPRGLHRRPLWSPLGCFCILLPRQRLVPAARTCCCCCLLLRRAVRTACDALELAGLSVPD